MLVTGLLTLQTMFVGAGSLGGIIHVPADSPTIQIAIVKAAPFDTIIVAPGTYHETINFLGKAITLRSSGGADVTTIDATGIGGSVVTCAIGEGHVLDGFTITGGTGTNVSGNTYGGGMYNGSGSGPTVTDCNFSGNTANAGGGMYNYYGSPTVTNCTFSGNIANAGGGMYNDYDSPTVTNCTFSGNIADGGGGMFNWENSPTVTNCTFSGNTATLYGGGGMYNSQGNPTVTNCTFIGNTADHGGGGMYNEIANPTVSGCTFSGNTAEFGGGMFNGYANPTVSGCTFSGNTATYYGGGMYNDNQSSPTVTNCTFSGNTSHYDGGGVYNDGGSPTVINCIFWGDSPEEILNLQPSTPTIRFSDVQGGLPVYAIDGGGNIDLDPMFIRLPNPGSDGAWGGVDDDYGDLRLQGGSPCIDAGDPAFVVQPGETDLEGHARVLCGRVDMGAHEFGIGDYDCDQAVNLTDFVAWGTCMLGPDNGPYGDGCAAFDGTLDLDVDLRDFAIFQNSIFGP